MEIEKIKEDKEINEEEEIKEPPIDPTPEMMKHKIDHKKLYGWEGWKKEILWILFLGGLLLIAYTYRRDMDICEVYITQPCDMCSLYGQADNESNNYQTNDPNSLNYNKLNLTLDNNG